MKRILKLITSFVVILLVILFCVVATTDVSYSQINDDLITINFHAVFNDLFFVKSLHANQNIEPVEGPSIGSGIEAGTVLLFGAGILCLGFVGRFGPFKRY